MPEKCVNAFVAAFLFPGGPRCPGRARQGYRAISRDILDEHPYAQRQNLFSDREGWSLFLALLVPAADWRNRKFVL